MNFETTFIVIVVALALCWIGYRKINAFMREKDAQHTEVEKSMYHLTSVITYSDSETEAYFSDFSDNSGV